MGAKRYLIVSASFFPQNSPRANRTTELAKELSRQGHMVSVLTPHNPAQEELAGEYDLELINLGRLRWPVVPLQFRGKTRLPLRALRRLLLLLFEYPSIELALKVARKLPRLPQFDVLISIAAPHPVHWGVGRAFRRKRKPARVWIADCGDPYMGQENDSFSAPFYFKYVEKAWCRRADAIAVPVSGAIEAYYPEFRRKISVIPQGFRFQDYRHLKRLNPRKDDICRFAYAGLLIPGRRDPTAFLEHLVQREEPFEFHVFTKNSEMLAPFADKDQRIKIRKFIPRAELLVELARMDFLVNIENAGARQTPSKLIDYWLCRRPVLNVRTGEAHVKVVEKFLAGDYSEQLVIDNPQHYDITNVAATFDRLADTFRGSHCD